MLFSLFFLRQFFIAEIDKLWTTEKILLASSPATPTAPVSPVWNVENNILSHREAVKVYQPYLFLLWTTFWMIFFFSVLSLCCHFCVWPLIIWLCVAQSGATQHHWALLPLVLPSPLHYPELTIFVIKSLLGSLLATTANYHEITGTKENISRWKLCNGQFWC